MLGLSHGGQLVVGHDLDADLRPCQFRHVLLAEEVHGELACSRHITSCHMDGDIVAAGPGIYRSDLMSAWCFATTLDVAAIRQRIVEVERELPEELAKLADGVDTVVRPDVGLGVAVVIVVGADAGVLAELTGRLAGACLAEEATRR